MIRRLNQKLLGSTGIRVTEFCLGLLPMSPLHRDLPVEECIRIIRKAIDLGVNFYDTAESYRSQSYLGKALERNRSDIIIATKSMAETYDEMARSVEKSLTELQTDYIDIYHLHGARPSVEIFEQRKGALQRLVDLKLQKVIRAVGIATHNVNVVNAASERDDIDVVYALVNKAGLGIVGGTAKDMAEGIKKAVRRGKGVYVMKALGGGNLLPDFQEALQWARQLEGVSSVSVGVVSIKELLKDLKLFGLEVPETKGISTDIEIKEKRLLLLERFCTGCGNCVDTCSNGALSLVEGKARIEHNRCILCGYCSPECPEFLIRLV